MPKTIVSESGTNFPRIIELDGWRGISIIFVIVGHLLTFRYGSLPHVDAPSLPGVLSAWGVDIFFIISGFIITKLALAERAQRGIFSIRRFYIRRFFRIVPPFYTYLIAAGFAGLTGLIHQPIPSTVAAATFTCNLGFSSCGWFAGHSWTLAFEEQFYLSFPLVFYLAGRNVERVFWGMLIFLISFPFIRYFANLGEIWRSAAGLMENFSFICIGVVIAAYERNFGQIASSRGALPISVGGGLCLCFLGVLGSAFSFQLSSRAAHFQVAVNSLLLPPSLAWIVLGSIYRNNFVTRILRMKWLQIVGIISYSLYLWQQMFTAPADLYLVRGLWDLPPLMLLAAAASYYWVEKPCIKLSKALLPDIPAKAQPAAQAIQPQLGAVGKSLGN